MVVSNRKLAFGTLALGTANATKIGIQLVMLPLMARLLGPDEYGLYSLAMPVVMFVMTLADGGLGTSLSREPESNSKVWSSAFWVLLLSGFVLAVGLSIGSFFLGALAHQPRLPEIMIALCSCLLLFVLGVPANSRLARRGNLDVTAFGDVAGNIVGAVCAVLLALHGAGAWSLVAQTIVIYAVRSGIANAAAPMLPQFHLSYAELKPHIVLGGTLIGGKLIETGDKSIENSLIGRNFGAALLGSFSIAIQISTFLCGAVSNALWAALYAKTLHASTDEEIGRTFASMVRVMVLILFPMTALVAGAGEQLVHLLLGARWSAAVPFLQAFLFSTTILAVGFFGQAILYARGNGATQLRITIEMAIARVIVVAAAPVIGKPAMVVGIIVASLYAACRSFIAVCKEINLPAGRILAQAIYPAASAAFAGIFCRVLLHYMPDSSVGVSIGVAAAGTTYLAALFMLERDVLVRDFQKAAILLRP